MYKSVPFFLALFFHMNVVNATIVQFSFENQVQGAILTYNDVNTDFIVDASEFVDARIYSVTAIPISPAHDDMDGVLRNELLIAKAQINWPKFPLFLSK